MEDVFSIQDPHFWALSRFVYLLRYFYCIIAGYLFVSLVSPHFGEVQTGFACFEPVFYSKYKYLE